MPRQTSRRSAATLILRSLSYFSSRLHISDHHPADIFYSQIQEANETLADPAKRSLYNSFLENPTRRSGRSPFYDDDDDDLDDMGVFFGFRRTGAGHYNFGGIHIFYGVNPFGGFSGGFGGGFGSRGSSRSMSPEEEVQEQAQRKEREKSHQERMARDAERRARDIAKKAEKEEQFRAKKAEEELKKQALEKRRKDEATAQKKIWSELKAETAVEQRASCLHSEFWPKTTHRKKVKCESKFCGKRGITSYECPHCALKVCQHCLTKFSKDSLQ